MINKVRDFRKQGFSDYDTFRSYLYKALTNRKNDTGYNYPFNHLNLWIVVDDGGCYNVFSSDMFDDNNNYIEDRSVNISDMGVEVVTDDEEEAWNYADKKNREVEETSPNFSPAQGYYNESKDGSMKVTLTESKLNSIISESIKRVLSEGFFDSFPSMQETGKSLKHKQELRKKKKEEKEKRQKERDKNFRSDSLSNEKQNSNRASAKRRERVISRLKSDGVDVAQYAYRLWPDKDEDSARSYFYKCLDGKTNDAGDVYKFTSDEINRLYSMLANDEL